MVQLQTYHHKIVHAKEKINQKSNQEAQGKFWGVTKIHSSGRKICSQGNY